MNKRKYNFEYAGKKIRLFEMDNYSSVIVLSKSDYYENIFNIKTKDMNLNGELLFPLDDYGTVVFIHLTALFNALSHYYRDGDSTESYDYLDKVILLIERNGYDSGSENRNFNNKIDYAEWLLARIIAELFFIRDNNLFKLLKNG
jgi:hypothetical protein